MGMDRREFLKMGGVAAALGLGAITAGDSLFGKGLADASEHGAVANTGLRWGMVIDLKKFTEEDYKRCIEACHTTHNVPDIGNAKDEIKWIWMTRFEKAFPSLENKFQGEAVEEKPVGVLCNHCESPACVRVCPTKATFKSADGITQMDYHRCIGCRFCMAACPYGARSFNWRDPRPFVKKVRPEFPTRERGVVEKCNFCTELLAQGKQPACVEVSNGAMVFGNLNDPSSELRRVLKETFTIQRKPELGTNPSIFYIV